MKLRNKTKFLLVFGIIFVAFLLFNTNNVQAAEISDYKCKVEKDGYILYNNYFNTKDVTFERNYNRTYINVYNVDKSKFNEILNSKTKENDWLVLVEIGNDVTSVKAQDSQDLFSPPFRADKRENGRGTENAADRETGRRCADDAAARHSGGGGACRRIPERAARRGRRRGTLLHAGGGRRRARLQGEPRALLNGDRVLLPRVAVFLPG